MKYTEQLIAL